MFVSGGGKNEASVGGGRKATTSSVGGGKKATGGLVGPGGGKNPALGLASRLVKIRYLVGCARRSSDLKEKYILFKFKFA